MAIPPVRVTTLGKVATGELSVKVGRPIIGNRPAAVGAGKDLASVEPNEPLGLS